MSGITYFPSSPSRSRLTAGARFGGFMRVPRQSVLVPSRYAYQEASWLVLALLRRGGSCQLGGDGFRLGLILLP